MKGLLYYLLNEIKDKRISQLFDLAELIEKIEEYLNPFDKYFSFDEKEFYFTMRNEFVGYIDDITIDYKFKNN